MSLLVWQGGAAFPDFRLEDLRRALAARLPGLGRPRLTAACVYLLDTARPLDAKARRLAADLLAATPRPPPAGGFFVVPRKGTISPWSSKATAVFRNCGLTAVCRVERGVRYVIRAGGSGALTPQRLQPALALLHDRMTEEVRETLEEFFAQPPPAPGRTFDVLGRGRAALEEANAVMCLALSPEEIAYFADACLRAGRNPTDTELMMFGQVNSEHCRHKIFNARWIIDGRPQEHTLFDMIRRTHALHPEGTLSAYRDNAAVAEGHRGPVCHVDPVGRRHIFAEDQLDLVMKAETHNHPTAVAPFPGAATGVGGEIRDESATGRGAESRAGVAGLILSNLRVPGFVMPWERETAPFPARLATPLSIAIEAPLGGAAFGNEFGRPQICGFFRTYEEVVDGRLRGYHKPIMLAGGAGVIRRELIHKHPLEEGALIAQIGGPAMRIGLGGGAASSAAAAAGGDETPDFDAVQRGNPEMQRRCQEVIDACVAMGADNPILAIHDVGAGGLANACPELVEATGATFRLRQVPSETPSMSPMEIWCCEAQERYVLAVRPGHRGLLEAICARERCPLAFIGVARGDRRLVLEDELFGDRPVDMDIGVLLGKPPRMSREATRVPAAPPPLALHGIAPEEAFARLLRLPAVASKSFLVTIGDRGATGLVARDQMTGPYQLPLADCGVTLGGHAQTTGTAMALGERPPVALIDAPASGRLAVGEALTNLAGAAVGALGRVKLSANWMCACGEPGEDARLHDTVRAVAMDLCPRLGISIPVGKDSLSMRTFWHGPDGTVCRQHAPLSLIVTAFAPVADARLTLTPDLKPGASSLLLIDLGGGRNRLGGSALAQVCNQVGDSCPDLDDTGQFKAFFAAMQELVAARLPLAYHDRSDGGAAVTLAEMAMGGGRGLEADLAGDPGEPLGPLFSEELGAVLQVADERLRETLDILARHGLADCLRIIGRPRDDRRFVVRVGGRQALATDLASLRRDWSELSHRLQRLRDNPACADAEHELAQATDDPGLSFVLTFDPDASPASPSSPAAVAALRRPPHVAILREQGLGGHIEMAAAMTLAGFETADVTMTDLLEGRAFLRDFSGLVACGGFSCGDVLGAGKGWACGILANAALAEMFTAFFRRPDTFTLGVGNGCQMLTRLRDLIPGAGHWPDFSRNVSAQFESRLTTVEVLPSPSLFLKGMEGSRLPAAVAHGEGQARFAGDAGHETLTRQGLAALRYVDNHGRPTEKYPWNPDGSAGGLTGFTTPDGRATIMMPRPERGFRALQLSYRPPGLFTGEAGPWMRMFRNAFAFASRR